MRAAYEKGYKVITLVDCTACTSPEAQVYLRVHISFLLHILNLSAPFIRIDRILVNFILNINNIMH